MLLLLLRLSRYQFHAEFHDNDQHHSCHLAMDTTAKSPILCSALSRARQQADVGNNEADDLGFGLSLFFFTFPFAILKVFWLFMECSDPGFACFLAEYG